MRRLRQLALLPLMAASLFCQSSCGRLGYEEHMRPPLVQPDAGEQPADDDGDDAGAP